MAPRVLDASAMVALFAGHGRLFKLLQRAEAGDLHLLLPAAAIAEAEGELKAGANGWEPILLTEGVRAMPLTEHIAIEVGAAAGEIGCRQAAYEADLTRGVVVTRRPGDYEGHEVSLVVV